MERLTQITDYCAVFCRMEDRKECAYWTGCVGMKCGDARIYDRLAAYEDTGLEPEEVNRCKLTLMGKSLAEITEFDGVAINRLKELATADKQDRLVVLPCKVGDVVWLLQKRCKHAGEQNKPWGSCKQYWDNVYSKKMWGCAGRDNDGNKFECEKKEMMWYAKEVQYSLILYRDDIVLGKNLFLTREEAERALEGGNGDG